MQTIPFPVHIIYLSCALTQKVPIQQPASAFKNTSILPLPHIPNCYFHKTHKTSDYSLYQPTLAEQIVAFVSSQAITDNKGSSEKNQWPTVAVDSTSSSPMTLKCRPVHIPSLILFFLLFIFFPSFYSTFMTFPFPPMQYHFRAHNSYIKEDRQVYLVSSEQVVLVNVMAKLTAS